MVDPIGSDLRLALLLKGALAQVGGVIQGLQDCGTLHGALAWLWGRLRGGPWCRTGPLLLCCQQLLHRPLQGHDI